MDLVGIAALITAIGALVIQLVQSRRTAKVDAVTTLREDYKRLHQEYQGLRLAASEQEKELAALKAELCLWRSGVKVLIGQLRGLDLEPAWEPPNGNGNATGVQCDPVFEL